MTPVLIELTRGALTESVHRGIVAVMRADGSPVLELGDTDRLVYPRSAIKALQCLPLIESGAAERFGFGPEEIALACASHTGTPKHTAVAARMLEKIGLSVDDLACAPHMPVDTEAANALIRSAASPTRLHNNCSGKHAGLLAASLQLKAPTAGYVDPEHPVQRAIHGIIEELTGTAVAPRQCGIDGCSAPNWAVPVRNLATAFAQLGSGQGAAAPHKAAIETIMAACWAHPELVRGPQRLDTEVMSRLPGLVFMKTGAEAYYCAALPRQGIGIALKIDDGATRASEAVVMELLVRLIPQAHALVPPAVLRNWAGREVGERRTSDVFKRALETLNP